MKTNTIKKNYAVLNMHCASCAINIEYALSSQKGVERATVNYSNGNLYIEYVPSVIDEYDLKKIVKSLGYDLFIEEAENEIDTLHSLQKIQEDNLRKLKIKCIISCVCSIPLVIIAMFFSKQIPFANYIMWALSTPVVFYCGESFFKGAFLQLKHKRSNMNTLIALSSGIAYFFSVFNTLFPSYFGNKGFLPHVYFEASAVIITLVLLGNYLEEKAKEKTTSSIKNLMKLQPKFVTLIEESGQTKEIHVKDVKKDDIVQIKTGEKISIDGLIISGHSLVDESMISGESVPVEKEIGSKVFAGTINQTGTFKVKVTNPVNETILSHIIKRVQNAQSSKVPIQKISDKVVGIFVPVIIIFSIITFIAWMIWGGNDKFSLGLISAITVLIIACPCALGLAGPTAIMVGIGKAAEKGILIKDAKSLEIAKNINVLVMDKTGTITEGKPKLIDFVGDKNDIVYLVNLTRRSNHPYSQSITNHFPDVESKNIENFESKLGFGIQGIIEGHVCHMGNFNFLKESDIEIGDDLLEKFGEWSEDINSIVWFSKDKRATICLCVSDPIKPSSFAAIKKIHDLNISTYMLTGDNNHVAREVARQVGVINYKSEIFPAEKADFVKKLQVPGKVVAMVGDGINDSAALAQADVSIAMEKGSDIAIEVADMTIISNNLAKIPEAIKISGQTIKTIKQNLFWAFFYNVIGIPIAAGILYPVNGFLLNPMIASLAMALSSFSVVTNSLRIRGKK